MGLRKGMTNNPKGKPAGALNKMSKDMRMQITDFLEENFPKVVKEFNSLKGRDKLKFYTDLLQYAIPKLQSIELQTLESLSENQIDDILAHLKREYNGQKKQDKPD
jgi:hypothetical protein